MGVPQTDEITLPADPVQLQPTYATALTAFEKLPAVRVLFDNGAGTSPTGSRTAGDPYPAYERSFATLPVPGVQAGSWYLSTNGALGQSAPTKSHVDWYTSDANAQPKTISRFPYFSWLRLNSLQMRTATLANVWRSM